MMADAPIAHAVTLEQPADDGGPSTSFNQDLYQQFLAFTKAQQIPSSKTHNPSAATITTGIPLCTTASATPKTISWIIDTGPTDHMIYSPIFFTSIDSTSTTNVHLPNGTYVPVSHIRKVQVSDNLTLDNVLCVPSFSFNLISVSKLTKFSNVSVIFFASHCFVQDLSTMKMTGLAKKKEGLYQLLIVHDQSPAYHLTTPSVNASQHSNHSLWHFRLGHISYTRMSKIPYITFQIPCNNLDICEICPLAKQKKLPFPINYSNSNKIFDLVHCDIWGLFGVQSFNG